MKRAIELCSASSKHFDNNETAMAVVLSLASMRKEHPNCDEFLERELARRNLIRHRVPGDGHCQLHAVRHQLRNIIEVPEVPEFRRLISAAMTANFCGICEYSHIIESDDVIQLRQHISDFKEMRNFNNVVEWGSLHTLYQIACTYGLHIGCI